MPTLKWGSGKSSFLEKQTNESKQLQTQTHTTIPEESKPEKKVIEAHDAEVKKTEPVTLQAEEQENTILSVNLFGSLNI